MTRYRTVSELDLVRLSPDGRSVGASFPVGAVPVHSIATDGAASALLISRRRMTDPPFYGVWRVTARLVTLDSFSRSRGVTR